MGATNLIPFIRVLGCGGRHYVVVVRPRNGAWLNGAGRRGARPCAHGHDQKKKSDVSSIPTFIEQHWLWGHWAWMSSASVWKDVHEVAKKLGPIYRIRVVDTIICFVTDQVR